MATSLTNPCLVLASDTAVIAARKEITKAKLFTTNFTAEAARPGETLMIPLFTGGDATNGRKASVFDKATNNYEKADGTVQYIPMKFDQHYKSTFEFEDKDFNLVNGMNFWENAGRAAGEAIGATIIDAITDSIFATATEGGSDYIVEASSTISSATRKNVAKLRKACSTANINPGQAVLMLNPDLYAELLGELDAHILGGADAIRNGVIDRLFGFKAVVENNSLTGGNVGAIVHQSAIGIGGRQIVAQSPQQYEEVGFSTDDDSGLVFGLRRHGNPATGSNFCTIEALFGSALIQKNAIIRLVAGA